MEYGWVDLFALCIKERDVARASADKWCKQANSDLMAGNQARAEAEVLKQQLAEEIAAHSAHDCDPAKHNVIPKLAYLAAKARLAPAPVPKCVPRIYKDGSVFCETHRYAYLNAAGCPGLGAMVKGEFR